MDAYLTVLKKYAVFEGRSSRREYWMFFLFNFLFAFVASLLDVGLSGGQENAAPLLESVYLLAVFIPALAVLIRRLHDTGRSGHWIWISLLPLIGSLVLLVFLVEPGKHGPNAYGPDPKADASRSSLPPPVPPGWYPDPTGRYEYRYWDSRSWSPHVSDSGVTSLDPVDRAI